MFYFLLRTLIKWSETLITCQNKWAFQCEKQDDIYLWMIQWPISYFSGMSEKMEQPRWDVNEITKKRFITVLFSEPWWWKDKSLDSTKEVKNIFKRRRCFLMNTALFKLKNHHQRWKIDKWSSSTVTLELVSSFLIFGCYNHLRQQARFLFMTLRYCANHHRFYLQHHRLLTTCFPI